MLAASQQERWGDVIIGLKLAQELLPFPLLGVDNDNGSEFINYELMDFCEESKLRLRVLGRIVRMLRHT
jgi:hypothetical protein